MPIMYFDSQLPLKLRRIIYLNPVAYAMKCFQDIFYYDIFRRYYYVIAIMFISMVVFISGYSYFASKKELFSEFV